MANANAPLFAFNRGILSRFALARTDLGRTGLSAEIQKNWMPRSLGSMSLRPGLQYLAPVHNHAQPTFIPFIFSTDDVALIELTEFVMRIWVNNTVLSRTSVGTTVLNPEFENNLDNWTNDDDLNSVSAWDSGRMLLRGSGFSFARRYQQVTIPSDDRSTRHALRIVVARGPVTLRVGNTLGDDNYISTTSLQTGVHSLAFTPGGLPDLFIQFESALEYSVLVDSVQVETQGEIIIPTPFTALQVGAGLLPSLIRYDQSADVLFIAVRNGRQMRIERRASDSWSLVDYVTDDGPYRVENLTPRTITPSAIKGDITLTASSALFKPGHVGALFTITSTGQQISNTFSALDQAGDFIKVVGVGGQREFTFNVSGTFVGGVTLQRSVESPGAWVDVPGFVEVTAPGSGTPAQSPFDDTFDNQIIFYRFRVSSYTSGSITVSMTYESGSLRGTARVVEFISTVSVKAVVLKPFGGLTASSVWSEGSWSEARGFPTAVKLYESRLFWAGRGHIWASVTDAFDDFDPFTIGDSGPINRTIGFGPVEEISWMHGVQRLIIGTQGGELSIRSSSDNEPLTPFNFNIKGPSNQGSSHSDAVRIDSSLAFIQRSGSRVYEVAFDFENNDYVSRELSIHVPELGEPTGYNRVVMQRQPDTRLHFIRGDGTVALLLFNKAENLLCWIEIETDGLIRDAVVLPGVVEDKVYYVVERTVNGSQVMYLEQWGTEAENQSFTQEFTLEEGAKGPLFDQFENPILFEFAGIGCDGPLPDGTKVTVRTILATASISGFPPVLTNVNPGDKVGTNLTVEDDSATIGVGVSFLGARVTPSALHLSDSHVRYDGVATTVLTGYDHLEGREVVVWADGKDQGTFTVSGGQVTLPVAVETATGGLSYQAKYRSTKLAYADELGTALTQVKKVDHIGLILKFTHHLGVQYGRSFTELRDLTQIVQGGPGPDTGNPRPTGTPVVPTDFIHCEFDERMVESGDVYDTDSRIHLVATAPKPATVLGLIVGMGTYDDV